MNTLKSILSILLVTLFVSCDSNEDNNTATTCESDFFGFSSSTSYINSGDTFSFGKYHKSGTLGALTTISSGNALTGSTGWMNYYASTYNPTLNELTCLLPSNNSLIKCNTTTGATTTTSIGNVAAPTYLGTSLLLLKYSSAVMSSSSVYPKITSVAVQIVDATGTSVSGTATTINLTSNSLSAMKQISSATDGTKIYYLANCELIIYDTVTHNFNVKTIDTYDNDTNRKFYQGLELKNNNTLVALKQTVVPSTKIEIAAVDITNLTPTTLPNTSVFNITQSLLPSSAPTLAVIINAAEYRTTTYDTCDDNYYFTYTTPSVVAAASTKIFEVKLNSTATSPTVNVYTDGSSSILFALEKGQ